MSLPFSRGAIAVIALGVTACGLLGGEGSEDEVAFDLPQRGYALSTGDARWRTSPPPTEAAPKGIPESTCGPKGLVTDCCRPAPGVSIDCQRHPVSCQPDDTCALEFIYESVATVNLAKEVSALKGLSGRVVTQVVLERLEYTLTSAFNVSPPAIELFVAPVSVTTTTTGDVRRFAVVPRRPPGWNGTETLVLDLAEQQAFSAVAREIRTSFNVIAVWRMVVRPGTAAPAGQVTLTLGGRARARL